MTLRGSWLSLVGLVVLLWGGEGAQAQDRGAPRFGPSVSGDTIEAEASDAGRVWSLVSPPVDRFAQRYGMKADSAWATHLRRSMLRLPGCAGALVSADGLALTTARCVRRHLDENVEGAVVAEQAADERSVSDLYADRLVGTSDVTAEVRAARQDTAVGAAVHSIEQQLQSTAGPNRVVDVSTDGEGRYTAYTYRRDADVRLAFLPEQAVSAFGGLEAALTYPRQALDVALLRVYTADGRPLTVEHFFEPASQGVRPGDPVFSAGPSAPTRRAESAAQLAVRGDLVLPDQRDRLSTWTQALRAHLDTAEASPRQREVLRDAERVLKKIRARLEALQNEYVQTRLDRRDAQFRRALRQDPALQERYGGLLDSLAVIQASKRTLGTGYRAFGGTRGGPFASTTYRRILHDGAETNGQRASVESPPRSTLRAVDSLRMVHPVPVEAALLAARLEAVKRYLQPDTAAVRRLLGGQSPAERAATIVEQSAMAGAETEGDEIPRDDLVAEVAAVVGPHARSFFEKWQDLTQAERRLTRRLAGARQAVRAAPVLPSGDAPRLTDGRVLGYPYNGTTAPPFTTFFGLYEQNHAFGGAEPWILPEGWKRPRKKMDRSVPLNFVASVDGAVSTSGAPLFTPSLGLVGMAVGPNIQGVASTYLFLPERMRTVAVDLRGLREALTAVYGADALVDELFGGARPSPERP